MTKFPQKQPRNLKGCYPVIYFFAAFKLRDHPTVKDFDFFT